MSSLLRLFNATVSNPLSTKHRCSSAGVPNLGYIWI